MRPPKQRTNRFPADRIDPARLQFCERLEHEEPLAESGMRHDQAGLRPPLTSIQNQVEVQRPGGSGRRPLPPAFPLNLQQSIQQRARRQAGLADDDAVQVSGLLADADGRRVEPGGLTEIGESRRQAADGKGEVSFAVTEVAPQGDRDRGLRYWPVQRAPMTTPVWSLMARDLPIRSRFPAAA